MKRKWNDMRLGAVLLAMLLAFFLCPTQGLANDYSVETEGLYILDGSSGESIAEAKEKALQDAMRRAVEEASVFISSDSAVEDLELTQDEVIALACGILRVEDAPIMMKELENGMIQFTAYIQGVVSADPADLRERVANRQALQESLDKYQKLVDVTNKIRQENKALQERYSKVAAQAAQHRISQEARQATAQRLTDKFQVPVIDITPEDSDHAYFLYTAFSLYNYEEEGYAGLQFHIIEEIPDEEMTDGTKYMMVLHGYRFEDYKRNGTAYASHQLVSYTKYGSDRQYLSSGSYYGYPEFEMKELGANTFDSYVLEKAMEYFRSSNKKVTEARHVN